MKVNIADSVNQANGYTSKYQFNKATNLASYVIEEKSGRIYAYPGINTGYTAYADTNLTSVLNNAMGQLTNGGLIQIRSGLYDNISTIVIPYDNITLEGEGQWNTKLKLVYHNDASNRTGDMIFCNGKDNLTFRNLDLDGYGLFQVKVDNVADNTIRATSKGISARDTVTWSGSDNILIENCYFHDFARTGFILGSGVNAIVRNSKFDNNFWVGIEYWDSSAGGVIEGCDFSRGGAISIFSDSTVIRGCRFWDITNAHLGNDIHNVITLEQSEGTGPDNVTVEDCDFDLRWNYTAIWAENGPKNLTIRNIRLRNINLTNAFGIAVVNDVNTKMSDVHAYDLDAGASTKIICLNGSTYATIEDCTINDAPYIGIYLINNASYNNIVGNYIKSTYYGVTLEAGCTDNIIMNNIIRGTATQSLYDLGTNTTMQNNYVNNGSTFKMWWPNVGLNNKPYVATDAGLTTGIITPGSQNTTVTSSNANYICCLPEASATTIGTVITGTVGANGFELRVAASQATTVYLNGVTTNVEAAIPANTNFKVTQIDATHWILECTTALGAVITAIVPDAVS